ncbi:hypothetical protein BD310DRAFT_975889 [Dichomitus squalens]|uniref:Uncharacterized protein n=1 Tax=Dichomitus squalens TaxID=114155 RepID=A0A4Q9Q0B8_9APHY|nr:hypothetical protein BD310DRAFT_975889 [Dichomitus squalens]
MLAVGPEGLFDKVLHLHADLFESFASKWREVREVTFCVSFLRAEIGNAFFAALGHRKRGPWRRFRNKFTRMGALQEHGPLWRDKELSAAVTLERQGVTATVAAFGTSWYAQRSYQAKKEESKSPAAIPTWEYRMTSTQEHQPQSNSQEPLIHRTRGDSMEPVGPKDVPTPKDPAQPGTGQSATLSKVQGNQNKGEHQAVEPAVQPENDSKSSVASKARLVSARLSDFGVLIAPATAEF